MARRKKQPGFLETVLGLIVLGLILGAIFHSPTAAWSIIFGILILWAIGWIAKNSRLRKSGIIEIEKMDGASFERYLQAVFSGMGFAVERTPVSGDFGADLVIGKDGVRTVVQAKRSAKNVGVRAVQEALAAERMYRCTKAIVVTNSRFTAQAEKLAAANGVELWDRDHLVSAIISVQSR